MSSFTIIPVRNHTDLSATISLFTTYAASLNLDLSFQDFSGEMAAMPGKYAPPNGELFLARSNASREAIGCIGLRPLFLGSPSMPKRVCEMKRLYVTPEGRGEGVARALVAEVLRTAEQLGYEEMRLDTLSQMVAARRLYESLGFEEIERYYETPVEGTVFLGKKIGQGQR